VLRIGERLSLIGQSRFATASSILLQFTSIVRRFSHLCRANLKWQIFVVFGQLKKKRPDVDDDVDEAKKIATTTTTTSIGIGPAITAPASNRVIFRRF